MESDGRRLAARKKKADEEAGEDELDRRRNAATAVPAAEAVAGEELTPARPRESKDVLEVRGRSGERAGDGRIERSSVARTWRDSASGVNGFCTNALGGPSPRSVISSSV